MQWQTWYIRNMPWQTWYIQYKEKAMINMIYKETGCSFTLRCYTELKDFLLYHVYHCTLAWRQNLVLIKNISTYKFFLLKLRWKYLLHYHDQDLSFMHYQLCQNICGDTHGGQPLIILGGEACDWFQEQFLETLKMIFSEKSHTIFFHHALTAE